MRSIFIKTAKFNNLFRSYLNTFINSTPAFVRIIPTDKCNLNCQYCWQKDGSGKDMLFESFITYLEKAVNMKVGLISFLGGEPMIWEPLYKAISLCTKNRILTDLTTNGTLLNQESIDLLGNAGLDYLNISVDGLNKSHISEKNSLSRNEIIESLKKAKSKYRMHFRINSVIYKNNFDSIKELIDFSKKNDIQLSLGFIVPPLKNSDKRKKNIYFEKSDTDLLREITQYILEKKKNGYPIIDPDSYFQNIFRYLNREKFWYCNYPTRYGWINVTPSGKIRTCTKKMDEIEINFLNLDSEKLRNLRLTMKKNVQNCNIDCYSNCAYDSYFYMHNKFEMIKKILKRIIH